ncbi:hypothetical protein COCC4DRAFT_60096 [Bipolaris maydis ATCC 48331]|uniref:UBA domain-containing protein n=2 Tax=Cochliobolus heterostrophus TaxID=5016 RepID=M2TX44_COCH5|nr:uncharacterized protein COCC4DRAFT_60096 [Bipolaris maydis ATCC 48331]EMD91089.1 hypothetical protein COCHEDRAFT_1030832 [Bipolaris maydis C5]KAJ5022803.1 hypothetical protein J3E73DRAFT_260965 [Bipolaris maydis]ENI05828.1 hypothetical protein COCC4DRAFT_60096 [Bipolaris maydis ATCC 48331]KAJ5064515.1 hypothetical protein J3E74DRAFT_287141 [Bipolaris maydis]KAJ6193470.1 hypothetical protein J3E72DRAFT_379039 [Bipolaris maydis]
MAPKAHPLPFKPVSAGKANFEGQRAAIRQNIEIFKTREDHPCRIFKYLVAELYARSERQGEDDITEEQHDIVERLRSNSNDFNLLYGGDSDFENESDQMFDVEDEAYLISQRDEIIKQVIEQLDQPIVMRDDVEASSSPESTILEKARILDPTESFAAQYTEDEISIIRGLADLTGAPYHRAEQCLSAAHWDLELALSYLEEDRPASSAGGLTKDQSDRLITFIQDRPVQHVSVGSSDGAKRRALGPQESVNLFTALFIKLQQAKDQRPTANRRTEEFECAGIKTRVEEVIGETDPDSSHIEAAYTAPANKPKITTKRKPKTRNGISHTGLPMRLDATGNVTSRTGVQGTPYQQYLQMRRRLQIQHYGHEAVPSEDPHRGVPTRERCPPPLVQEASSDEEDDNAIVSEHEDSDDELQAIIEGLIAEQLHEATKETEAATANKVSVTGDEVDSVIGDEADSVVSDLEGDTCVNSPASDDAGEDQHRTTLSLRDPSQPKKLYMKVRFNVGGVKNEPRTTSALRDPSQPKKLHMKVRFNLGGGVEIAPGESSDEAAATEQVEEEEEEERGRRGMGLERETEADEAEKRRRLFVSDEEDAWDGTFSDEELDVDEEGEDEEGGEEGESEGQGAEEKDGKGDVGEEREDQGRVDELMDD